ncbi:Ger(x)C family spore germination protein [Gottfriedia acidiceleris]|uniref:Ger(x)C family spore germination protein n=1 Tax=Gottfriedia acidiceleris TaxID=371036 RepID=UPI00101C8E41|nr:Ger(x)C family spore germination protein [Gottfriedia acidiceleris]
MKKALFLILLLPLLTGCWDRLELNKLHLVDVNGFDLDDKTGEVKALFLVTKLKSTGQGTGVPISKMQVLKGPSVAEAIGEWEFTNQSPFIGISTRVYLISQSFAVNHPVSELDFLLDAPYSSINTPILVVDGNLSKVMETSSGHDKEFTKELNEFIISMEKNKTIPTVSMMNFIQSRNEPFSDLALPMLSPINSELELSGALLFRNGKPTGKKLDRNQVKMMMLLEGGNTGRQRFTGNFSKKHGDKPSSDTAFKNNYGFTVKRNFSKIIVSNRSSKLPKISIKVKLQVSAFELGEEGHKLKPNYARMEKVLNKHFEEMALETIKTMQSANSDVLGIGKELKAFHPKIWKSLNWRKDYPRMSIEPKFDISILNSN